MRTLFFFPLVFLFARTPSAQNYTQNAPPVQQAQVVADCYTRNLDYGNAALRRGEVREALRLFTEAKNCPEAQDNSRRQSEIDTHIARCEAQLGVKKNTSESIKSEDQALSTSSQKRTFSTELPIVRRNYAANRSFLKDTVSECFQRMVEEADRAYRLNFWEDAAALYRAAKNCADADQKNRQLMSERIAVCRNAAESALFTKQQEAERQARHAIAANLADDAEDLLVSDDRSLAFRLADFANQYIAPDDNMDCVQAMFDAWYYQPSEASRYRQEELYHPVFCYELADNLGDNTQVKFEQQKDGTQWLWAFVPKTGDMFAWELPSMKLVQAYGVGEGNGYLGFDISPDGTLLFWGNKFFELRRGTRIRKIELPAVSNWCFSARGDEFFFENLAERKIYILNVREALAQQYSRKGSKNANILQAPVEARPIVSDVPKGLIAMQYVAGKFWLGFADRVEVLGKSEPGKPWNLEKRIPFNGINLPENLDQRELRLSISPKEGFAVLGWSMGTWIIPFANQDSTAKSISCESTYPLAVSGQTRQIACQYNGSYQPGFWILDALTGDTIRRQHLPPNTYYDVLKSNFSSDANWLATPSPGGNVSLWALQDASTVWANKLPLTPSRNPVFSPDGTRLFVPSFDSLVIFKTNAPDDSPLSREGFGQPLSGTSNQWAMLQVSPDSAEALNFITGRKIQFPLKNAGVSFLYAFDAEGEKLMAYLSDWNKVEIRSLQTGALLKSKIFEGGAISELRFLPETDNLLIVQYNSLDESNNEASSVKLWSPLHENEKSRALRLHEYPIRSTAVDALGRQAAFTNGSDIRIFNLQNIENELLKIRSAFAESVLAIAFRPNSQLLAAAYSTGKIIFWDLQTGQESLQLQALQANDPFSNGSEIASIGFSNNGSILHIVINDGRLLAYALDPSYIREVAQDENRQLLSFSPEQIVRYNLEAALYYPGNFDRLAESGDGPLVRSFFQHFRGQAVESNNIVQVRNYCERALYLYERLDENTRQIWQVDMRVMYEDYARKLLLRGNTTEAAKITAFIRKKFGYKPDLLEAHLALLNRDFPAASTLYSKYILTSGFESDLEQNNIASSFEIRWNYETVEKELMQLKDFELIDSIQANCFCGMVSLSGDFFKFCPLGKNYPSNYLSATDRIRWEIVQKRSAAENTLRHAAKAALLQEARQKAKNLTRINPAEGQIWLEKMTLELAQAHRTWGVFEQKSPEALEQFENAAQLLLDIGEFRKLPDTNRLSLLASTYLVWGSQLLEAGKSADALAQFNLGLQAAEDLYHGIISADTTVLPIYMNNLIGPLFLQAGTAYLLEGNPVEARKAYDNAGLSFTDILSPSYQANVAVFENDETQAFLDYGKLASAEQTARGLFDLSRLAAKFEDKRVRIDSFASNLREALRSVNPKLINVEADYWLAKSKIDYFAAQSKWDSAVVYSKIALQQAKLCTEQPKTADKWVAPWLDEHIDVSYYLLLSAWNKAEALEECIQYGERAQEILAKKDGSGFYYLYRELLKTNLAHALILRNHPGDRERAIDLYNQFLQSNADENDNWDTLEKDFRELKRAGVPWPAIPELEALKPKN